MDSALLLSLYRQMALARRFEEAAAKAYAQGKIGGFLHLYIGQEGVAVGAISAAAPTASGGAHPRRIRREPDAGLARRGDLARYLHARVRA